MKVAPVVAVALWRRVVPVKEEISSPLHRNVFLTCEDCSGEHLFHYMFHLSQFQNLPTPGFRLFECFLCKLRLRTSAKIMGTFESVGWFSLVNCPIGGGYLYRWDGLVCIEPQKGISLWFSSFRKLIRGSLSVGWLSLY